MQNGEKHDSSSHAETEERLLKPRDSGETSLMGNQKD